MEVLCAINVTEEIGVHYSAIYREVGNLGELEMGADSSVQDLSKGIFF